MMIQQQARKEKKSKVLTQKTPWQTVAGVVFMMNVWLNLWRTK